MADFALSKASLTPIRLTDIGLELLYFVKKGDIFFLSIFMFLINLFNCQLLPQQRLKIELTKKFIRNFLAADDDCLLLL